MQKIPEKLQALLNDIDGLADRDERSDFLIELASRFTGVPASIAQRPYAERHRVPGCESEAFVFARRGATGGVEYFFAVENPQGISAKALAVILAETLNGESAEHVQAVPEDAVQRIFGATISMGKGQGLMGIIRSVKSLARAFMPADAG